MAAIKETDDTEQLLESIELQEQFVRKLAAKVDVSKERLKDDKAEYEEAVAELRRRCGVRLETPLLDGQEDEV